MSPRPTTISTEHLVEVAEQVFLAQGVGAATSEIARQAGVSEAAIFKRFSTKQALFMAAMKLPEATWTSLLSRHSECPEALKEHLVDLAQALLSYFQEVVPRLMLLRSHPAYPDFCGAFKGRDDAPPARYLRSLTGFFEKETAAKNIRGAEPRVMARIFLGTLYNYASFEVMGLSQETMSPSAFSTQMVETLWRAWQPESGQEDRR